MKIELTLKALALLALFSTINPQLSMLHAQGTAFHYQGQLQDNGRPANGLYDFQFSLSNAPSGGSQVGGTLTVAAVGVTNGLFTTTLDFGPVFAGKPTWLAIGVRTNGVGSYVGLNPLQQLTPTPYAIFANTSSNLSGTVSATQLNGMVVNGQLANSSVTVNAGNGLSGGGTIALGGTTTLNNAGVTSLTGGGGVTVSAANGSVTLGSTATSANTANAIVSRDGSGNFSAGSVTLDGNLILPAYYPIIYSGSVLVLRGDFDGNFFIGSGAGNLTLSGQANTGNGDSALASVTSGFYNTANGNGALISNTSGSGNTANGFDALSHNTSGSNNIALGFEAGYGISAGSSNIDIGNLGIGTDANIIRIGSGQSQTFIAGVINGNGAGLTNLNGSQIAGGLPGLTLQQNSDGAPNLIGGSSVNFVSGGVVGATIGGGGAVNYPGYLVLSNSVESVFGTVGGGIGNTVTGGNGTVGGGTDNTVGGGDATIAGGDGNTAGGSAAVGGGDFNTASGQKATVGGGENNTASGSGAFIGGGGYDGTSVIGNNANGNATVIGGGMGNIIPIGGDYGFIGGGEYNTNSGGWATVGGGLRNTADSSYATVGGGAGNIASGGLGTVGGGTENTASGVYATVSGGQTNTASGAYAMTGGGYGNTASYIEATVGGGYKNTAGNSYATVDGGYNNTASGVGAFIGGGGNDGTIHAGNLVQATAATIGGGLGNNILSGGNYAFIGGGMGNTNAAVDSTIGGGDDNIIEADSAYTTISGGSGNFIDASSAYSTIGGGGFNLIDINNSAAAIAGGSGNQILAGDANSFIGGGYLNKVLANSVQSTISGGYDNTNSGNYATIGGGYQNAASQTYAIVGGGTENTASGAYATVSGGGGNLASGESATVSGGAGNTASGSYSTVGGGNFNFATGNYSFAAGNQARAQNQGAFVWADSQTGFFNSTANDQVSFRCEGGVRFTSGSGAANQEVSWTPGTGSWSFSSDRNLKNRFEKVDSETMLDKVSRLPIVEWSYKGYPQRHIGAMAQDFHTLFPLNDNDTILNDADLHGVELAAIQGLNQKLNEKDAEIQDLKARLEKLEQLVAAKNGGGQ